MSEMRYRPLEKRDYDAVGQLINKSFGLYRYVPDKRVLKTLMKQYLLSCLAEQTYSWVAEKDGAVVGVIMGNAKSDYRAFGHAKALTLLVFYTLKLYLQTAGSKDKISDYKNIHQIYAGFLEKSKEEFDGVLTLFAVSEACRGLGVGKKLLSGLLQYLKEKKVKKFYLFTDSTCNFGFYDSQGFQRLAEDQLSVTRGSVQTKMSVYLYGYELR